jgi:hypothetical protein
MHALTGRLQARSTNQESINILLRRQLLAVLLRHTPTINDPRLLRRLITNLLLQPRTDRSMHFLRLLARRNLTRPNRPNRFIRDNNLIPMSLLALQLLRHSTQLARHNLDRLASLPLLQTLTTAQNYTNAALERGLTFRSYEGIVFLENDPALGVPEERPGYAGVFELVDADFAGEGAVRLVEDVLGGYFEAGAEVLACKEEVEGWRGNDDFCGRELWLAVWFYLAWV